MEAARPASLQGFRVVSFESRRASELAELIRRYGGEPIMAPSMREVPLGENTAALDFLRELEAGKIDFVIFLTGVGTRTLVDAVASQFTRERLTKALRTAKLVARGPKPVAALKDLGLRPDLSVPEPNTWRDILSELDSQADVKDKRVAVQEYGVPNHELIAALKDRRANVVRVPVYRWALPEDPGPLRSAIARLVAGEGDMALFTNATQVLHLFQVAKEEGRDVLLRQAFQRVLIASIGPVCSEALEQFGLKADLEPKHPKMGHLVTALAQTGPALLNAKRRKT